jgi:hypothetical protein
MTTKTMIENAEVIAREVIADILSMLDKASPDSIIKAKTHVEQALQTLRGEPNGNGKKKETGA